MRSNSSSFTTYHLSHVWAKCPSSRGTLDYAERKSYDGGWSAASLGHCGQGRRGEKGGGEKAPRGGSAAVRSHSAPSARRLWTNVRRTNAMITFRALLTIARQRVCLEYTRGSVLTLLSATVSLGYWTAPGEVQQGPAACPPPGQLPSRTPSLSAPAFTARVATTGLSCVCRRAFWREWLKERCIEKEKAKTSFLLFTKV